MIDALSMPSKITAGVVTWSAVTLLGAIDYGVINRVPRSGGDSVYTAYTSAEIAQLRNHLTRVLTDINDMSRSFEGSDEILAASDKERYLTNMQEALARAARVADESPLAAQAHLDTARIWRDLAQSV